MKEQSLVSFDVLETYAWSAARKVTIPRFTDCGMFEVYDFAKFLTDHWKEHGASPIGFMLGQRGSWGIRWAAHNKAGLDFISRVWAVLGDTTLYQIAVVYKPHHIDMTLTLATGCSPQIAKEHLDNAISGLKAGLNT